MHTIILLLIALTAQFAPTLLPAASSSNPHFAIVIPSYNNEAWCIRNIASCANQDYPSFHIYYINDASTDRTGALINEYVATHRLSSLCTVIHNPTNKGALQNLYETIHTLTPNTVVITVDGDDWLAHPYVLKTVARAYRKHHAWLTYGNYISYPQYKTGHVNKKYPHNAIRKGRIRKIPFCTSHLRTFYAGLFQRINRADFLHQGRFYSMGWDVCMMMPMIEMAGRRHVVFLDKTLYVYNKSNPLTDSNRSKQRDDLIHLMLAKPVYKPLQRPFP